MKGKLLKDQIGKEALEEIAKQGYGHLVKIAVDIKKETIALGCEWHSECQSILTEDGSLAQDVWGANIHINQPKEERLEFHSLINIKPSLLHKEMEIQDEDLKGKITKITDKFIQ